MKTRKCGNHVYMAVTDGRGLLRDIEGRPIASARYSLHCGLPEGHAENHYNEYHQIGWGLDTPCGSYGDPNQVVREPVDSGRDISSMSVPGWSASVKAYAARFQHQRGKCP